MSDLVVANNDLKEKRERLLQYVTDMCERDFIWQSPANDSLVCVIFTNNRIYIQRGQIKFHVDNIDSFCECIWRGGLDPKYKYCGSSLVKECFDIISPAMLSLVDARRCNKNAINKREISAELESWSMPASLIGVISEYAEASKYERLFDYVQKMRITHKNWKSEDKKVNVYFYLNMIQIRRGKASIYCVYNTSRFCEHVLDRSVKLGRDLNPIETFFEVISPAMLALIE